MMEYNYARDKQLQIALQYIVERLNPQIFGTIVFNRLIGLSKQRKYLSRFHHRVDKKILGPNFFKLPKEERTFYIAFPEHIDSNVHYHLMILPGQNKHFLYQMYAPKIWRKVCPGGSIDLVRLESGANLKITSRYSTKEAWKDLNYENFIISSEFLKG